MKKSVFITGATVGTGYATAEKFAEAGYCVFIASRSQERAQEA
ncbi:MAG: SDR family NAD(P)-dependent oxidoreductase, partial [Oscillospiraceae bacterium]|nr:SDR family NAD(P)-dependent oxidoreductase [Oscillospiraceae bacterium]